MRRIFIKPKKAVRSCVRLLPVCLLVLVCPAPVFGAGPYQISWFTMDGGGGISSGGMYTLSSTIGQPDCGTSSNSGYELNGGFQQCNLQYQNYIDTTYDQWYITGKPECWNYPRQCLGDADNKYQDEQIYWVSTDDLDILIAAWNKPLDKLTGNQICADFDHLPQGRENYRVSTNDIDILIANWQIPDGPAPKCQQ